MPVAQLNGDNADANNGVVFEPFDPRDISPQIIDPDLLSTAPSHTESQAGEDVKTVDNTDPLFEGEPLPRFDPKVADDLVGLLFLGALSSTFHWAGHTFKIRTLKHGEILEVAEIHRPYVGTLGEMKAYQSAIVAGCIVSVDGKYLPAPLSSDPTDTSLSNKYEYINSNWFAPVIDVVYDQYLKLEVRVQAAIDSMDRATPFEVPANG